jgi:hypothetical protein
VPFVVNGLIKGEIEKTKCLVSWFDCDESLTWRCLNSNSGHFGSFTFIFVLCGESCLLVSCCAGGRCDTVGNDEYRARSRRFDIEDWGWPNDQEVG